MTDAGYHHLDAAGNPAGPVSKDRLAAMALAGDLRPDSLVWTEGWADWQPASSVEGLTFAPPLAPGAIPPTPRSPWAIPAMPRSAYKPGSFRVLNWWYLACSVIATLLFSAGMAVLVVETIRNPHGPLSDGAIIALLVCVLLGCLVMIPGAVCFYVLLYRCWRQIQDGHARTGPGKAVGFMFIPLFNYYWFFVALWGLAQDLDAYAERHGVDAPTARPGFALATCITMAASALIGTCAGALSLPLYLAAGVMWLVMVWRFASVSARIAHHLRDTEPAAGAPWGASP